MRLSAVVAAAVPVLLSLTSACKPTMRYGYSREARGTSEYLLVKSGESGERVEQRGIGPERLRMHLYDPFDSNWPSSSRTFYVDLGPECRLMARRDAERADTGQWSTQDFIQAEAHFVEGKPCSLTVDSGATFVGTVKTGVMVIRPASVQLDLALNVPGGAFHLVQTGAWN